MYKKIKDIFGNEVNTIFRIKDNAFIPFDPANVDFSTFKADILADKATLQDADGNVMTAEQAKQFVQELP